MQIRRLSIEQLRLEYVSKHPKKHPEYIYLLSRDLFILLVEDIGIKIGLFVVGWETKRWMRLILNQPTAETETKSL